jgi:hypothetical protein
MDIGHNDRGTAEYPGPTDTLILFQDLASQRPLVWADGQLARVQDVKSCPEKVRYFVMENGGHSGHTGCGIACVLAQFLQLEEDPFVSSFESVLIEHFQSPQEWRGGGLMSAKGGLMMGTKKVGAPSSPQKRANSIIVNKNR